MHKYNMAFRYLVYKDCIIFATDKIMIYFFCQFPKFIAIVKQLVPIFYMYISKETALGVDIVYCHTNYSKYS